LMPRKRSWLNSGRERPTKIVFGVLLLVDRVAVAALARPVRVPLELRTCGR
jgi:hypothetical protein